MAAVSELQESLASEIPKSPDKNQSLPEPNVNVVPSEPKSEPLASEPPLPTAPACEGIGFAEHKDEASQQPKPPAFASAGQNLPVLPPSLMLPQQPACPPKVGLFSPPKAESYSYPVFKLSASPLSQKPASGDAVKSPGESSSPIAKLVGEMPAPVFKTPAEVPPPVFRSTYEARPEGVGGSEEGKMEEKRGQTKVTFGPSVIQAANKGLPPQSLPSQGLPPQGLPPQALPPQVHRESPKPSPWVGALTPPRVNSSQRQIPPRVEERKGVFQSCQPPQGETATKQQLESSTDTSKMLRPLSDLTPRPLLEWIRVQANLTADGLHWACPHCTLENEYKYYECAACANENNVLKGIMNALGEPAERRTKSRLEVGTKAVTSYFKSFF